MTTEQAEALADLVAMSAELLEKGRALVADGADPLAAAAEVIASASPQAIAAAAAMSLAVAIAPPPTPPKPTSGGPPLS